MRRIGIRNPTAGRAFAGLVVLATAALAGAGCGGGEQSSTAAGPVSTRHASTTAELTSSRGSSTTSAAGTGSRTPPPCTTSGLAVWIGLGAGGAAAGSVYYPLELTNVTDHACRLFGFPGVSARDGHQLGSPAQRDASRTPHRVKLAAGATAHTVLRIIDVGNFPAGTCKPATARTLRVFPPNQTSARDIPFSFRACSAEGDTFLSVEPVQPGVGVPGYADAS